MTLDLTDLSVRFETSRGSVLAVDRACLRVGAGERIALVGESGCGKTVLALALLGLLPRNARCTGSAAFDGRDLLDSRTARSLRGREISMCWSNAERFFNPVIRVGRQIGEAYLQHHPGKKQEARARTLELLERMGFAEPHRIWQAYPCQLSGGMNQRAMIAMSLINQPQLLLVDEPTRGLDDESRDRVVECLLAISGTSMLVITHDMDLVHQIAQGVYLMQAGKIPYGRVCPQAFCVSDAYDGELDV
ncbi:MAG: ATP-binding cassette domain-containing protein [Bryobacteraceae bacterium]